LPLYSLLLSPPIGDGETGGEKGRERERGGESKRQRERKNSFYMTQVLSNCEIDYDVDDDVFVVVTDVIIGDVMNVMKSKNAINKYLQPTLEREREIEKDREKERQREMII
jgi:hypothetical protein